MVGEYSVRGKTRQGAESGMREVCKTEALYQKIHYQPLQR